MRIQLGPMRPAFDSVLVLGGVVIIVVQVLAIATARLQVAIVAVGIVMIYIGVWRLRSRLLRDRRVYRQLRSEVDHFLTLVRKLNAHAVSGESALFDDTRSALQESVDRMASVAGVSDNQS